MSTVSVSSEVDKVIDNIIKSPEDARLYCGLELKNGMKVLLISDQTTDKSAASLDVHIGMWLLLIHCMQALCIWIIILSVFFVADDFV